MRTEEGLPVWCNYRFGNIPSAGESIKVVLKRDNPDDDEDRHDEDGSNHQDVKASNI
ncbi:hypothetical protein SLEP1_g54713 [Rubroshorea leprosula]|uniref:Uncharacterized protein n=1 Tax=Rubroshorea leprosula TaxID=152421 RepID=A0AAV5MDJ9_9ROSI|nr:hypothetical protein SLEP1_g54713 [Rubroshorea leprosula]